MLHIGVHLINHGDFDVAICRAIQQSQSLRVGPNTMYGAGVYAYYVDRVPIRFPGSPFVVFQPLPARGLIEITEVYLSGMQGKSDSCFFLVRGPVGSMIHMAILGFVNCPQFPAYAANLYYTQ
jgi:hypothetical protein